MQTLEAQPRTAQGSRACAAIRAEGNVPAVLYGGAETAPTLLTLDVRDFEKMWRDVGESTVIQVSGLGDVRDVLIQDVQVDPLLGTPVHVDLLAVRTDQAVRVEVPLVFTGVAPAEKGLGGSLVKVMHELEVEALPKDLPHQIEISIESLKTFDDQFLVRDVVLPAGVAVLADAEEVVALVQAAREEEEAGETGGDISDVEVEKKGKGEEVT